MVGRGAEVGEADTEWWDRVYHVSLVPTSCGVEAVQNG